METLSENIVLISGLLGQKKKAINRKKMEIAKRIFVQKSLFPEEVKTTQENYVCGTLFEVKADVSENNMKNIFSPYKNEINRLQSNLLYLQRLETQASEADKLQSSIF